MAAGPIPEGKTIIEKSYFSDSFISVVLWFR